MDLSVKAERLRAALTRYERVVRQHVLGEAPHLENLTREVESVAAGLETTGWTWFEGAEQLRTRMKREEARPRLRLLGWRERRAWSRWPERWGVEVQRPIFVAYWKWGPVVVRRGFYARGARDDRD